MSQTPQHLLLKATSTFPAGDTSLYLSVLLKTYAVPLHKTSFVPLSPKKSFY